MTICYSYTTLQPLTHKSRHACKIIGDGMLHSMANKNIPISGFMDAVEKCPSKDFAVYPLSWCSAGPSSFVTKTAFDHVTLSLCTSLRNAVRDTRVSLAAVYLDLHGAMVS